MKNIRFIYTLILLVFWGQGCNPDKQKEEDPKPDNYFIISVVGEDGGMGILINDPENGKQYAGYGTKDKNGNLDSLKFMSPGKIRKAIPKGIFPKESLKSPLRNAHGLRVFAKKPVFRESHF